MNPFITFVVFALLVVVACLMAAWLDEHERERIRRETMRNHLANEARKRMVMASYWHVPKEAHGTTADPAADGHAGSLGDLGVETGDSMTDMTEPVADESATGS